MTNKQLKPIKFKIGMDVNNFNLNNLFRARGGVGARSAINRQLKSKVGWQIRSQLKNNIPRGGYLVQAHWHINNRGRDLDNLILKPVFDSLQDLILLENDNLNNIDSILHTHEIVCKSKEGIEITFYPMERYQFVVKEVA